MHPAMLDDLLALADGGEGELGAGSFAAELMREVSPSLVVLARPDGTVCLSEGLSPSAEADGAERLVHDAFFALRDTRYAMWQPDADLPRRIGVASRLGTLPTSGVICCLAELPAEPISEGAQPDVCDIAGVALTAALLHERTRNLELSARVDQLLASQEALHTSHTRSLAETIEEHTLRLRHEESAQHELRRAHTCNQLILNSAGEGIVGLDTRGYATFANPAAERWMGWTATDLAARPVHLTLFRATTCDGPNGLHSCPVCRTLGSGSAERVEQTEFWRKDGTSFPVSCVVTPIRESDTIAGAVLTFEDITERKLLESQLVQAQKMESIGQLAAGIAHEVNTPTQFVGDNLRFLQQAFAELRPVLEAAIHPGQSAPKVSGIPLPTIPEGAAAPPADWLYLLDEIPNAISQSLEGLAHVARIVQSMREFSHPGTDQMHSVDLHKILDNAINVCRNEWKYTARVVRDFDPNLPLVMCYPSACSQVFLNLIVNAAHAVADKLGSHPELLGQITISTRIDGDWVEVRVSDTGTGIRPEIQPRVFEPFFTTKAEGQGTGQGLAIARSAVVDKHGGTLTFETVTGEGTIFIVRLPGVGDSATTTQA
jgi:PAS domain S-box-containing protein